MDWEGLMQEALALALHGRGEVEPNPRVGAIALQDGEVVGRGFHSHWGGPHAEVMALHAAAAQNRRPDTLVVTLEPCSSPRGTAGKKTPPCTLALIEAGIRRVVVGALDPDPRHRRTGILELEAKGVQVIDGVLGSRVMEQNRPFQKWLTLDRPWTLAKWAMTLDGKTAAPSGESRWISGPEARRRAHLLRSRCDAVIVGFRTATIDDPELTVRHVEGAQPVRIVVDPLAELADDSNLVRTALKVPTWMLVNVGADPRRTGHLQDLGVQVIAVKSAEGGRRLHLRQAWRELRRRGLCRVLVEGGGGLLAQLMSWQCVDQLLGFVAPKIIGGSGAPTPVGGEGRPFMAEATRVEELSWQDCDGDLQVSGFLY
jgi:diaminohydroxyphosphoribosylaminopyrimidine deaminase / 5-amino-6-(5-phosphoribosylamino)uracil reductase